ncbi:hypothetical protein [Tanticharoenia sakaeratensis]|nr:hypothetical protein [Tanticharoenia sakaeratensis]
MTSILTSSARLNGRRLVPAPTACVQRRIRALGARLELRLIGP